MALASSQAADKVKATAQYQKSLSAIYSYFSHSSIRIERLCEVQRILDEPEIKMKHLYQVRWLSLDIAVDAVVQSLPALMTFFEHEAQEEDPTAIGIHRCITTYKFLALTHFVKDILSVITKLSLTFQLTDIDVSLIQPKVTATIDALDNMKSHDGPCLKDFTKALANGDYILYNVTDNASQRSSFDLARREFIGALKKNVLDRFMDTALRSAFKIVYPKHYPASVSMAAESKFGEKELDVIVEHFSNVECDPADPHPPTLDAATLRSEYLLFRPFVIRNFQNFQFDTFAATFLQLHSQQFPEMAKLISIIVIIPVTSVPCERGFSSANRIKTRLRNRLLVENLDVLLRIVLEGPPLEEFDFVRALSLYKSTRQHRIFQKNT